MASDMTNSLCGNYRGFGKEQLKIWIFWRFLRTVCDGTNMTFCSKVFHCREAATGKARSPM